MEEQGLVVVKDNLIVKLTNTVRHFFFKGKIKDFAQKNSDVAELITNDTGFVQQEILDARRAYRKYVINNSKYIANDIIEYTTQKIFENEKQIKEIINVNEDSITFEEIVEMINNEKKQIGKFKNKNKNTGTYKFPIGVVGIECSSSKRAISGIFKAISSRNAIIILHNNYNKYSTESLILLIVKECLKNFYIDDNIVQMFSKEEIDISKLNKFIGKEQDELESSESVNRIYIYQDNDIYCDEVKKEVERLQNDEMYKTFEIKPIKGEFRDVVNYLSDKKASAICMYTDNEQRAYKLMNWIDSPNIFINTEVSSCREIDKNHNILYGSKFIVKKNL